MKQRIKQIIPAPPDMYAYLTTGERNAQGHSIAHPIRVCCLALVEEDTESGPYESVSPMIMMSDEGCASFVHDFSDFVCIGYEDNDQRAQQ